MADPETTTHTGAPAHRRWSNAALLPAPVAVLIVTAGDGTTGAWVRVVVAAVVAAVVLQATARRAPVAGPLRLVGFGITVWAGADAVVAATATSPDPPLAVADLARSGSLVLVAASLVVLGALHVRRVDWVGRVDTAIVTVSALTLVTVLVLPGLGRLGDIDAADRFALGTTALALAFLAAAAARFAVAGAARDVAGQRLVGGAAALFLAGMLHALARIELGVADVTATGAGLAAFGFVLVASAVLHPSARALVRPGPAAAAPSGPRLAVLTSTAALAPVTAVALGQGSGRVDVAVLAASGATLVVLFAIRLELMVRAGRRWAQRESTLRDASGAIGSARGVEDIWRTLQGAIRDLVGDDLRFLAAVTFNERGAPSVGEVAGPTGPLDPVSAGLAGVVPELPADADRPFRVGAPSGGDLLVVPVSCRIARRGALLLGTYGAVPDDLDESLAIAGAQAALALDAVVQAEELHSKRSEARFQQIVRNSSDAILILDGTCRIRYQTPSVVRVLGFLGIDLDGAPVGRLVHPDHVAHLERFLDGLLHAPAQSVRTTEIQLVRADDSIIHAEVVGSNLLDEPDVAGLVLTVRDVTGRRALEDQLRHQAFHDALTGLPNRALFVDRVDHALDRVRRADELLPAVVFIDLDDFKTVNDSLGHSAGDALLRIVADRLRRCLRSGDTPARLSGDEFAVLLEDAPHNRAVVDVAERVLEALHEPVTIEGNQVYVKASIGVATRKGPATTSDELLRNADLAMYTAKANGKGCVALFEPSMYDRAVDRLAIKSELERSVKTGDLDVAYQPIVRLSTGEVTGFEALARWTHPMRGPISPVEFVPIAEDTGLILQLGRVVLERACQQLAAWHRERPGSDWRVSVNLSARQLLAPGLVDEVRVATREAGIPPASLTLELTESVLLSDTERVLQRLRDLKELGVQIAIDDFGTGYSSLSYLQRVPFDILKIDRAFVSALRTGDPETTLVRTIMDLAHTLGRTAVAEGVEDETEAAGLRALGCEYAQGFLFGGAAAPDACIPGDAAA